ncbi:unnamed protein product, partial [Amoebophrya sp. A120]
RQPPGRGLRLALLRCTTSRGRGACGLARTRTQLFGVRMISPPLAIPGRAPGPLRGAPAQARPGLCGVRPTPAGSGLGRCLAPPIARLHETGVSS